MVDTVPRAMAPPILRPPEPPTEELLAAFAAVRAQQRVPLAFPPEVEAAAAEAATRAAGAERRDLRHLDLVTIDPPGSQDLDQALGIERRGDGWRVHYAVADVAAFVQPGDAADVEARARGVTLYSPDLRTPLHPTSLSERAASLLPGVDRPAVVWRHDLGADGRATADPVVERAIVHSRAQLDYPSVQAAIDAGTADELMRLLREVGRARLDQEQARGGVSLDLAEQEVVHVDGHYRLVYRRPLPVESWNAQLSLLTGMAAAGLMVAAGVGLLRTLPDPDPDTVAAIRRSARALGLGVSESASYPEIVRAADPATDAGAALLHQAARALRGAGYSVLDGGPPPAVIEHSAIASTYAHVTAPLRRLGDRFAQEVALALGASAPVPGWVRDALPALPKILGAANERDGALARAMVDVVEALMLRDRVGEVFDGVVTNVDERGAVVQLRDPAVLARVGGIDAAQLGRELRVRLDRVDVPARKLVLSVVASRG